jgi:hypothetical protein
MPASPIARLRRLGIAIPPLATHPKDDPYRAAKLRALADDIREAMKPSTPLERVRELAAMIAEKMPAAAQPDTGSPLAPPPPSATRAEAEAAIEADARGELVDWPAIARRAAGDILAHGEDRDRLGAARFFAPTLKPEAAPEDETAQSPDEVRERALEMLARVDPMAAIRARNA